MYFNGRLFLYRCCCYFECLRRLYDMQGKGVRKFLYVWICVRVKLELKFNIFMLLLLYCLKCCIKKRSMEKKVTWKVFQLFFTRFNGCGFFFSCFVFNFFIFIFVYISRVCVANMKKKRKTHIYFFKYRRLYIIIYLFSAYDVEFS